MEGCSVVWTSRNR